MHHIRFTPRFAFSIALFLIISTVLFFTISPYTIQPVLSGSNSPAQQLGDLIVINREISPKQLEIGDVIVYSPINVNYHIIHRIIAKKVINGDYYFLVKGDANSQPDVREEHPPYQLNELINFTSKNGIRHEIVGTWYHESLIVGKVTLTIPIVSWPVIPLFTSQIPPLLHIYLFAMMLIYLYFRYQLQKIRPIILRLRQTSLSGNSGGIITHAKTALFITPIIFSFILTTFVTQTIILSDSLTIDYQNSNFTSFNDTRDQIITYLHQTELKSNQEVIESNRTTIRISYHKINTTHGTIRIIEEGIRRNYLNDATENNEERISSIYDYIIELSTLFLTSKNVTAPLHRRLFPYLIKIPAFFANDDPPEAVAMGFIIPIEKGSFTLNNKSIKTLTSTDHLNFIQDMLTQSYSLKAQFNSSNDLLLNQFIIIRASIYLPPLAFDFIVFTIVPFIIFRHSKRQFLEEIKEKIQVLREIDELSHQIRRKEHHSLEERPNEDP